jgi:hypothetical protein
MTTLGGRHPFGDCQVTDSRQALGGHALAFPTWRSLAREQGLPDGEAVALMSVLVEGAATAG